MPKFYKAHAWVLKINDIRFLHRNSFSGQYTWTFAVKSLYCFVWCISLKSYYLCNSSSLLFLNFGHKGSRGESFCIPHIVCSCCVNLSMIWYLIANWNRPYYLAAVFFLFDSVQKVFFFFSFSILSNVWKELEWLCLFAFVTRIFSARFCTVLVLLNCNVGGQNPLS